MGYWGNGVMGMGYGVLVMGYGVLGVWGMGWRTLTISWCMSLHPSGKTILPGCATNDVVGLINQKAASGT
jgi:hypothetical protein